MSGPAKKVTTRVAESALKVAQSTPKSTRAIAQTRGISSQQPRKAMAGATFVHGGAPMAMPGVASPRRRELDYLSQLVKQIPWVTDSPRARPAEEFKFPQGTLFKAPTKEIGMEMKDAYALALKEHGVAAIELGFEDPKSQFILDIVNAMNCTADTHSGDQGALWDVTFKPEGVKNLAKGGTAHSISHSLGEFARHSHGAFEVQPQRFFGFHVMHPDKMGGGIFRLLRGEDLVKQLSPKTANTLANFEFDLRVPDEFFKGQPSVRGKLISIDPTTGHTMVRYRADIMYSPPSDNADANEAVAELQELLAHPEAVGQSMPEYAFKENMVLLMDNSRFLHSRTDIKDPKRWLRRVRFNGNLLESEFFEMISTQHHS